MALAIAPNHTAPGIALRSTSNATAYIRALVKYKGDIARVAEELDVPIEELALELVENMEALQKVTRAIQLIQLFDLANASARMLLGRMAELRADDLSKTYLGQVALIEKLTDEKTVPVLQQNNFQLDQKVLQILPDNVREAVFTLIEGNNAS